MTNINSKNRTLTLSAPVVMGILNATPDSFYNKGRESDTDGLLHLAEGMLTDGATILDIGGASTRPGQSLIDPGEEMLRVIPVITALRQRFPDAWLSIDTYNARVAQEAVQAGADIVNDVSAGDIDTDMIPTVAALQVPYIVMHMQGTPATMQVAPAYKNVTVGVKRYLGSKVKKCREAGIKDIIIDPGFGFGKTVEHNFELLTHMSLLRSLHCPILAGLSRKSMICRPLQVSPEHALNGTTALHVVALQQGAAILRVHDVKEAMEVVKLYSYLH